jgi:hypothetical protein
MNARIKGRRESLSNREWTRIDTNRCPYSRLFRRLSLKLTRMATGERLPASVVYVCVFASLREIFSRLPSWREDLMCDPALPAGSRALTHTPPEQLVKLRSRLSRSPKAGAFPGCSR